MKKTIAKNTGIISIGTNISRVLGLVRDVLIAKFFGTGYEAAAFVVAFTIPNMLRDFVGEGAANAAFVPVLTEYRIHKTKQEFWELANIIFIALSAVLAVITFVGVFAAPLIVKIIAPGFINEPGAITLTINLTRIIFPYILLVGLTAYSMGILNTLGHFFAPSFSPVLLNLSLILSAIFLCPIFGIKALAFGVLIGGVLQLVLQLPFLLNRGFRPKLVFNLKHPAVKKIGTLLVPRIIGGAVYQINIIIDRMLASLYWIVGQGGIPALYYSYRLIQYPLAIFSTALATAVLPVMAGHATKNRNHDIKDTLIFSLRMIFFILIPASIGFMVLGKPIIKILFQRGAFDVNSLNITYNALLFYSFGLFAYGGIRILATTFYSMNDTATPVKIAAISLAINLVFNLILMKPLKIGGLALATSIAACFNFFALFFFLKKKIKTLHFSILIRPLAKIISSSAVMGVVCFFTLNHFTSYIDAGNLLTKSAYLCFIIFCSMATYFIATFLFKIEETRKILKWILRRK